MRHCLAATHHDQQLIIEVLTANTSNQLVTVSGGRASLLGRPSLRGRRSRTSLTSCGRAGDLDTRAAGVDATLPDGSRQLGGAELLGDGGGDGEAREGI